jgi:orotate phosphoribosyltransferase
MSTHPPSDPLSYVDEAARAPFERRGAIRTGHWKLSSGLHSSHYVQCQAVMAWPEDAEALCRLLGRRFADAHGRPDAVIGPAVGAIVISHEVARALGTRSLFAEREGGRFDLRRGQEVAAGERVLVVENVITTGGSVAEVIETVRAKGGVPAGAATLVNRLPEGAPSPFGELPFVWLVRAGGIPSYEPASCPLCAAGAPLVSPGSRHLAAAAKA